MVSNSNIVAFNTLNPFQLSISYLNKHHFYIEDEPPAHIHELFEIYLNLSGNVSFMVENHIYQISRGSLIITRPFEYHHCICHDNKEHEHYCLQFSGSENKELLKPFFDREKGKNNHIILSQELTASIIRHLDKLLHSENNSTIDNYYHFLRVLQIIQNNAASPEPEISENIPENLRKVLDIISVHYMEPINVATLASDIFVSVNTLERYFKRYLNITPSEYIKRKRLSVAMKMLKSNTSVSLVASQCGFSDTSNFIQIFKRAFGKTPYQYLKSGIPIDEIDY